MWVAAWRTRQGYESAARVVKLDPIEELVAASVLMRPAEEGLGADRRLVAFQFTHQKLCEQVLLRELRRRIAPRPLPAPREFLEWARHAAGPELGEHDDFAELVGALEVVAARLAEACETGALARFSTWRTNLLAHASWSPRSGRWGQAGVPIPGVRRKSAPRSMRWRAVTTRGGARPS